MDTLFSSLEVGQRFSFVGENDHKWVIDDINGDNFYVLNVSDGSINLMTVGENIGADTLVETCPTN